MMIELATRIKNGHNNFRHLFDSVVGQIKTHEKRWIVDIDTKDEPYLQDMIKFINSLRPYDISNKIEAIIPTKSGYHLITCKFDMMGFSKQYQVDVQKKNPTLLYLPNSLYDTN